ncbi:hypothetical protein KIN20_022515 [Parelaphostrongylus tenuis]|uniref:Uncharacterized protein n=1 Tax=Parelaphostrongylus tenuis TaxID=148309 RepID=A0AAD5QV91_PARTN|nr:hypothetical protein KIN20_022515 [Parelaphostrongylus tenuis]
MGKSRAFGCEGMRMNDTNRTVTLLAFNGLRAAVALGQYFDLSSTSLMNKLVDFFD